MNEPERTLERDPSRWRPVVVKVRPRRLDPKAWRETAAKLRERAKVTREAERQRFFPALAEHCEQVAKELEQAERQD